MLNRRFPSCHWHVNINLRVNKTNFHIEGFALGLALKQRRKATRKSPIRSSAHRWTGVVADSSANHACLIKRSGDAFTNTFPTLSILDFNGRWCFLYNLISLSSVHAVYARRRHGVDTLVIVTYCVFTARTACWAGLPVRASDLVITVHVTNTIRGTTCCKDNNTIEVWMPKFLLFNLILFYFSWMLSTPF